MNIAVDGMIFDSLYYNSHTYQFTCAFLESFISGLSKEDNVYLLNYNGLNIKDEKLFSTLKSLNVYLGPMAKPDDSNPLWLFSCNELDAIGAKSIAYSFILNHIDVFIVSDLNSNIFKFIKKIKSEGACKTKIILIISDTLINSQTNVNITDLAICEAAVNADYVWIFSEKIKNILTNQFNICSEKIFYIKKEDKQFVFNKDELIFLKNICINLASASASICYEVLSKEETPHKYKIAMFTPLPPEETGIADYSLERLPYWSKYFDMDVFTCFPTEVKKESTGVNNFYEYKDFDELADKYDYAIYHIGNSPFHVDILKYADKYHGIVVLHDANLREFFHYLFHTNNISEEDVANALFMQYGRNFLSNLQFFMDNDISCLEINKFVTSKALGLIVHSKFSESIFQKNNINLPIKKVPMSSVDGEYLCAEDETALRIKYCLPKDSIVLGCFGEINMNKRIYLIMNIFSHYISSLSDKKIYKLLLAGKPSDKKYFDNYLQKLDEQFNIKNNIIVAGRTSLDEFYGLMQIVNFAFNLRYPTNGETSASLARLMSLGVPVAVTNIDAFKEIPDDCCIKIRHDSNEEEDIVNAIKLLIYDKNAISSISSKAKNYMKTQCSLEDNALGYYNAIRKLEAANGAANILVNEELFEKIKLAYITIFGDDFLHFNNELASISELLFRLQLRSHIL